MSVSTRFVKCMYSQRYPRIQDTEKSRLTTVTKTGRHSHHTMDCEVSANSIGPEEHEEHVSKSEGNYTVESSVAVHARLLG